MGDVAIPCPPRGIYLGGGGGGGTDMPDSGGLIL